VSEEKDARSTFIELMENLGVVGSFMLDEVLANSNKKNWGASREEFFKNVDQVAVTLRKSGKWAVEDVDRAADELKRNWEVLRAENAAEWQIFLDELRKKLAESRTISQETFELAVTHATKMLENSWHALGKPGETYLELLRKRAVDMADEFKDQYDIFRKRMDETEDRIDDSVEAAWEEIKKRERS
jgi:hypothetical protein